MKRGRGLRRLWRSPWVFAAAVVLFASGLAAGGSTLASFTAETQNSTATFAGGWLGAPTNPTVTPSGYSGQLAWTPATHGLTGQAIWGYDNGTSSTCTTPTTLTAGITSSATTLTVASAAGFPSSGNYSIQVDDEQMTVTAGQGTTTWTVTRGANGTTAVAHAASATVQPGQLLGTATATASSYTDSSTLVDNPRSGVNGHYACYTLVSTHGWTAATSASAALLGLVPTSVAIAYTTYFNDRNGTTTVTITFNQSITYTAPPSPGTFDVCLNSGASFTLTLGSATSCTAGIGTFTGGSDGGKTYTCTGSTASASGNQLIVTVSGCPTGTSGRGVLSGSATYVGAGSSVASSVGAATQCTTAPCQLVHTYP